LGTLNLSEIGEDYVYNVRIGSGEIIVVSVGAVLCILPAEGEGEGE
jgi:hypothetical protein